MPGAGNRIDPPFSPPDCPWVPMSPGSEKPERMCYLGGKLNGEDIYIGRVYDDGCYLNGTVILSKGICTYLSKKLEVKTTDTFDILTLVSDDTVEFRPMFWDHKFLFVSGGDEDMCVYTCCVVDGENTYYGWGDIETKTVYIPRESNNKLTEGYGILVHKFLDRLCICPAAPTPPF